MSTDNLDELEDAQLNEVFALEVAGWTFVTFPNGACPNIKHWSKADGKIASIYNRFTTDANNVLPWMEKGRNWDSSFADKQSTLGPYMVRSGGYIGRGHTFARAACIALIRSHRATQPTP